MADPTDRTSMDDLTDYIANSEHDSDCGCEEGPDPEHRAEVARLVEWTRAWLRGRDLLLGPDGLLRAERVGIYRVIEWSRDGLPLDSMVQWVEESDMLADDDLFTLSPLDPPEDT